MKQKLPEWKAQVVLHLLLRYYLRRQRSFENCFESSVVLSFESNVA